MDYSELYAPEKLMTAGCSDGGCLFIRTPEGGMKTNGGCQCEKKLRYTPEGMSAIRTIRILRDRLQKQMMALSVEDRRKLYPSGTHEKVIEYGL